MPAAIAAGILLCDEPRSSSQKSLQLFNLPAGADTLTLRAYHGTEIKEHSEPA